jgi:hypothetical protein
MQANKEASCEALGTAIFSFLPIYSRGSHLSHQRIMEIAKTSSPVVVGGTSKSKMSDLQRGCPSGGHVALPLRISVSGSSDTNLPQLRPYAFHGPLLELRGYGHAIVRKKICV